MMFDAENLYSDAQALTATAASTNIIDHGSDRNLGYGTAMTVYISLDVAADDADGDETYTAVLQTDDNSGFSSATQVGATVTITRGDAAGTVYALAVPKDTVIERYTRLNFTLGGTTPTVTVTAFMTMHDAVQSWVAYADGITIST